MRSERVKLDYTKELFNTLVTELKTYIKIMGETDCDDAVRVLRTIEKHTVFDTDESGADFAVIRLYSSEASSLIYILAIMASIDVDADTDYYTLIREGKNK